MQTSAARTTSPSPTMLRAFWLTTLATALLIAQSIAAAAQSRPSTFADLAEQVSPSVVNITTSTTVATSTNRGPIVPEGSPFEEFFDDEVEKIVIEVSEEKIECTKFCEAVQLFKRLVTQDKFEELLTLSAYKQLSKTNPANAATFHGIDIK